MCPRGDLPTYDTDLDLANRYLIVDRAVGSTHSNVERQAGDIDVLVANAALPASGRLEDSD